MFAKFISFLIHNFNKVCYFLVELPTHVNKPGKLQITHLLRSKYSWSILFLKFKNFSKTFFKKFLVIAAAMYSQYFKKLNWRPLFKKTSYFGLYRSIRNRWVIEKHNKK